MGLNILQKINKFLINIFKMIDIKIKIHIEFRTLIKENKLIISIKSIRITLRNPAN